MQNRYFGDIGDFGKYGMLRVILKKGLKLGVNWYLYPDENHNNDGKYIKYLDNDTKELASCDIQLYYYLKNYMFKVNSKQATRNLQGIEKSGLLENTVFYKRYLIMEMNRTGKKGWFYVILGLKNPYLLFKMQICIL